LDLFLQVLELALLTKPDDVITLLGHVQLDLAGVQPLQDSVKGCRVDLKTIYAISDFRKMKWITALRSNSVNKPWFRSGTKENFKYNFALS